jgi:hypothetical protein
MIIKSAFVELLKPGLINAVDSYLKGASMPIKRKNPTELEVALDHADSMRDEAVECLEQAAARFEALAASLYEQVATLRRII